MVEDRSFLVYLLRAFLLSWCVLGASTARADEPSAATEATTIAEVAPANYGAGAELVVKGTGFRAGDQLRIGAAALEILEIQPARLRVRVPATLKRGGPLKLIRDRKPAASFDGLTFVAAPVLNGAAPPYARVGQTVTLRGRNLAGATALKVGEAVVPIATQGPASLTFVVPEGLQTGLVAVSSVGGSASLRKPYEIYYPAIIEAVTPERFAAGMTLEVRGKSFAEGDRVSIGRATVAAPSITPTRIQLAVSEKLMRGGPLTIARRGKPAVSFDKLTFVPSPKLRSARPAYASPGATVTLSGTGLATVESLKIGEMSVPIATQADRSLTFVVPEKAKTGVLTVKSLGAEASLTKPYEIFYPPVLSEVSPKRFAPGATLRVTGTHLATLDTARLCNARLAIKAVDDKTLELAVPAHARKCTTLQLSQRQRSSLKVEGFELVVLPVIELTSVTPKLSTPGVLEVSGKGLDSVQRWSIGELVLSPDPGHSKEASPTQQWLRVEARQAKGPLVAEAFGKTITSATEVELTVSAAQVSAMRYAPDGKGGATGVLRGSGFTPDTAFELDGTALKTKLIDTTQVSFKLSKLPASGKHRVLAVTGGTRGTAYELDGDAAGYRFRAAEAPKLLEGKLPKYALDEIELDIEQSSVVFAKPAESSLPALKSVSKKAESRRDVAQTLEGLATELARLAVAQRALCAAMKKGQANAAENTRAGTLLARASKQAERLLSTGVRPLWSGLPAEALAEKANAKDLELTKIDQRLGEVIATRTRLNEECADRFHAASDGKLVGRAWETIETGIEREYDALVEQSLSKIVKASKDRKAGEKTAKKALDHAFASGRRAFAEKRLARALESTKSSDKPTGKGAVTNKRAEKVGKK
jgi:hypothetical protein